MHRIRNALGLSLLGLAVVGSQACTPAGSGPPKTIVLVSLDTLRPERLGIYGNSADVSPQLDAIAARGVVFEDALAPAPWTLPSHMSLLTGLDPVAHGVRGESDVLVPLLELIEHNPRLGLKIVMRLSQMISVRLRQTNRLLGHTC